MTESFPRPRDIEKDKEFFLREIENSSIEEIPVDFDEKSVEDLSVNIQKNDLFLLGETHGAKENVDVIYTLFKKFDFRVLALEWAQELKNVVDDFVESGELDFDLIKDSPDGRITAGHFALIKKLKDEQLLEKLICFDADTGGSNWDERDKSMADTILKKRTNSPVLVVAGNLHTKTTAITFGGTPEEHHPMGEHIKESIPEVSSGKIAYLSGQYYNYGTKNFGNTSEQKDSGARFYSNDEGLYVFELPTAHTATVPNPEKD